MSRMGSVVAICIASVAQAPMQSVERARLVAGAGIEGDRYCTREGSFNRLRGDDNPADPVRRQVTLMNIRFFEGTIFQYTDSRRNLFVRDVELMWLIGREFEIGEVRLRGVKYCDPCNTPSKMSGKPGFAEVFQDCGGLVAEVLVGGWIQVGSLVVPPPKGY